MKKRLRLTGWFILMVMVALVTVILMIGLAPVWFIVWPITGKWFSTEVGNWFERVAPIEVTS